jgi:hypothetical protein
VIEKKEDEQSMGFKSNEMVRKVIPMEDVFYSFNPNNMPLMSGDVSNKSLAESTD